MTRLFLPPEQLLSEDISITGDQARHLALVLRVQPDESITVFDGQGFKYVCRIVDVHKKEITARLMGKTRYSAESPVSITLAQGVAKGEKMDLIIQKSTELGVNNIIPLITGRSLVRHTGKLDRWKKIALSASQQSGRDRIPEIAELIDFGEFLNNLQSHPLTPPALPISRGRNIGGFHGIIFSEEYKARNLKQVLSGFRGTKQITILVGPEGGFAKGEVTAAVEKGFIEASLGPRILRTETAPIAAISIIQYELGDVE
jgi:16S rRNA (uracil1498-N3)-methyltransferase